mmetsp:Transcript_12017/g.50544  ORF Transcript_12017/g.50544 Transcript_12017/m.50544 type:complete len:438 (+) Transcript_12017:3887-5200(+)
MPRVVQGDAGHLPRHGEPERRLQRLRKGSASERKLEGLARRVPGVKHRIVVVGKTAKTNRGTDADGEVRTTRAVVHGAIRGELPRALLLPALEHDAVAEEIPHVDHGLQRQLKLHPGGDAGGGHAAVADDDVFEVRSGLAPHHTSLAHPHGVHRGGEGRGQRPVPADAPDARPRREHGRVRSLLVWFHRARAADELEDNLERRPRALPTLALPRHRLVHDGGRREVSVLVPRPSSGPVRPCSSRVDSYPSRVARCSNRLDVEPDVILDVHPARTRTGARVEVRVRRPDPHHAPLADGRGREREREAPDAQLSGVDGGVCRRGGWRRRLGVGLGVAGGEGSAAFPAGRPRRLGGVRRFPLPVGSIVEDQPVRRAASAPDVRASRQDETRAARHPGVHLVRARLALFPRRVDRIGTNRVGHHVEPHLPSVSGVDGDRVA